MALTPIMAHANDRRERIRQKAVEGIHNVFPLVARDHTIEVQNVQVAPKTFSSREQKDAILAGRTLQEPVKGDLVVRDPSGKAVQTKKGVTLAQLPYFTPRHTFIVGGNEYTVANQRRVRPGVYTRVRGNEELEAAFNLAKGENFRVNMHPEKGHLFMEYGTTRIPLYPVLRQMGMTDKQLGKAWGKGVVDLNKEAFERKGDQAVKKLYERLVPAHQRTATTTESMARAIKETYRTGTQLDKETTKSTLGKGYGHVTEDALTRASKKLLDVHRKGEDTDDRDSLTFQTLHGVEDFFKERIQLEGRGLARKVRLKARGSGTPDIDKVVPVSPFTKSLRGFITTANLSAIPQQINPVEMYDSAVRITTLGEGGISTERAVPAEARNLHSTHLGTIDPSRTPESFRAGVDLRSTIALLKDDDGKMYSQMRDMKTGRIRPVPVDEIERSTVAFPFELKRKTGQIGALRGGQVTAVDRKDVDFEIPHPTYMYGPTTNLVPMLESLQGNRTVMGSKMSTQALPLVDREAPWVQVEMGQGKGSSEQVLARKILPVAPMAGTVAKVDQDFIYLRPEARKTGSADPVFNTPADPPIQHVDVEFEKDAAAAPLIKVPYEHYYPLASKTYLHNDVKVKAGDRVYAGQPLADSNFTKDDTLALGKNLDVAYMAYRGANSNDAVVVSETGARKLTSTHMYKEALSVDKDVVLDKSKYRVHYANKWTAAQFANLDDKGVAKKGAKINPGDPLVTALRKVAPTAEAQMLGRLHKTLVRPFREEVITWEHKAPGVVQDVLVTPTRVMITVRTDEPAGVGDKLAGRYGNKGVISQIVPDDQMIRNAEGKPIDLLMTSAGIVSRINPAQIVETAVAKVAKKTGQPIIMPAMSGRNNVKWARDLLKKHNLEDKEVLHDPMTGKDIKGPDGKGVMTGPQYIYKLFKSTDTNYSERGVEDYDVNLQPAKGGASGAKGVGRMEINTLIAHDARNVLQETSALKGTRNDEWWRAYQTGRALPKLNPSFAYDKFTNMLQGAGVKLDRSGDQLQIRAMTDNDVSAMSAGPIKKAVMVRERDMSPEKGGLFDPVTTGGLNGTRWGHIDLGEPVVNPTFEDPVRRLLGFTQKGLRDTIAQEGGAGIRKRLARIDLDKKEEELRQRVKKVNGTELDNTVKQLKYIRALKKEGLTPDKAYTLSKLPVVPPVVRPIVPSKGRKDLLVADANYLYRDTMLANDTLGEVRKTELPEEIGKARLNLYDSTKATFGLADPLSPQLKGRQAHGFIDTIAGKGSPKRGFFHAKLLKMPQDLSGRGTIVPDLNLGFDEVGLPESMVWKTFQPHIIKKMVERGHKAVDAQRLVEERHPAAKDVLDRELKERPVMINRAPTLHRHGFIGAYAVPVPGKTIRINPFVERGLNADFDGDSADCDLDTFTQGTYSRIHISEFPRKDDTVQRKGNKELYEVPPGTQVFSYEEATGRVVLRDVTHFSVHHDLEMLTVTTSSKRTVKVSRDASMYAVNPSTWTPERVSAEDAIGWATPRPRQLHQARRTYDTLALSQHTWQLDEDLGWFLGAWAGDGWLGHRGVHEGVDKGWCHTGLANTDLEVKDAFVDYAQTLSDVELSVKEYRTRKDDKGSYGDSIKYHINNAALTCKLAELLDDCRGGPQNKHLPRCFVNAPRPFLLGLLGGLIDTDGSVTQVKAQAKNKPQWMVSITTTSKRLADEVGVLLTMLRVRSGVTPNKLKEGRRQAYTLTISMPDFATIGHEIPIASSRKRDLITQLLNDFEADSAYNAQWDVVPVGKEDAYALARLVGSCKTAKTAEQRAQKTLYQQLRQGGVKGRITRLALQRVVDHLGADMVIDTVGRPWFDLVTNENLFFDFIETAEPIPGRHTAWDLTVPGSNTFMTSNQIVVYDTMQVHVPVTTKAVDEVKNMTISNMLFGDQFRNDLIVMPQHEANLGMFHATATSSGKRHKFKTKAEAMTAYKRGDVDVTDTVEIG